MTSQQTFRRPLNATTVKSTGFSPTAPHHVEPFLDFDPSLPSIHPSNLPQGNKSLSGISIRSFALGLVVGASVVLLVLLVYPLQDPRWRIPFFAIALATFHFLEYWITARYNPRYANISAFLFSENGSAYTIAHVSAFLECVVSWVFFPNVHLVESSTVRAVVTGVGLFLVVLGQTVRTLAMKEAGQNFNHTIQTTRHAGHQLVTTGMYTWLRHPSYFGFFWWGLGTQIVLGNWICFVAYTIVLWKFFHLRIQREEKYLIGFFGDEYAVFQKSRSVGIPFIR